jgi:hypothetical protein
MESNIAINPTQKQISHITDEYIKLGAILTRTKGIANPISIKTMPTSLAFMFPRPYGS